MAEENDNVIYITSDIKVEPDSDSELEVNCGICHKTFASSVALQNHARISHTDAFESGDPALWTEEKVASLKNSPKARGMFSPDPKTQAIISSMKPTTLTQLASQDVKYIIIKSNDLLEERKPKLKHKKDENKAKKPELVKEAAAITGPFECEETGVGDIVCHQIFFSCCEYSEHQYTEHTKPRRRVARCQVCERPLSQLHQTALKDFTCEQCAQGFDTVDQLLEHKALVHINKKRYACPICPKKFSAQGGVVQHLRMHTGDRPYNCTFCPKAFTQKSGLEQHLRIHTKVKPYRCVICSKTFVQTVHLRQHMRVHTNVAPFQCVICEKRFKQSSHLNYHLKNHTSNMTDEQKEIYKEILQKMDRPKKTQSKIETQTETEIETETGMETETEMETETHLAEQSIAECAYEIEACYSDCDEKVVSCEIEQ